MAAGTFLNASVGSYRLVDFLGAGGMGEVYRAIHTSLGRVVAIKVLSTGGQSASLLERFRNEARIQAALQHPNVVALYDFLELGGHPCIVMEYVDGETLDQRIRTQGAFAPAEALSLFREISGAVAYLHERGIVHRDLKANNVKITADGRAKLLDFGLARGAGSPKLTATGHVVGTLEYMSPEQLSQQPADERSDIWALGVVLYEMVTGRLPFEAQGITDLMRRIITAEYFAPSTVTEDLPRSLDDIVDRCLQRNPADRVSTVPALIALAYTAEIELRRKTAGRPALQLGGLARPSRWHAVVRQVGALGLRPRFRTGAAVAASLAAVVTLAVALNRPGPKPAPSPPPKPSPVAPVTPVIADLALCGIATDATLADSVREITIGVASGYGELRCGSTPLGQTPVVLRVLPGRPLRLRLVRDGYRDEPVEFTPTWNTTGMQFDMHRLPDTSGAAVGMLLAWLPLAWFGRRKRPPASAVKATTELAAFNGSTPNVSVSVLSDIGCVRDSNEDAIGSCRPPDPTERARAGVLLVVADGMGGHSAGEVASRLAVETVAERYATDNADPGQALVRAVNAANRTIHAAAKSDPGKAGMGTTCTAVVVRQGLAYCAHVGDSRLYLFRDGTALQMTEDHSAVYDLVKRGVIDRSHARAHPDRNVIVRALGSRPEVEVAHWPQPLFVRNGDRFLVSSDGLHDLVSDEELTEIVLAGSPDAACRTLVDLARSRGGHDNISVGILAISDDAPTLPMMALPDAEVAP